MYIPLHAFHYHFLHIPLIQYGKQSATHTIIRQPQHALVRNAAFHLVFVGCSQGFVMRYDHFSCVLIRYDLLYVFGYYGVY